MAHKFWVFMLHKIGAPASDDKIKYKRLDWAAPGWDTETPTEVFKVVETEWPKVRDAVANGTPMVFQNDVGQQFHIPANSVLIHFLGYQD